MARGKRLDANWLFWVSLSLSLLSFLCFFPTDIFRVLVHSGPQTLSPASTVIRGAPDRALQLFDSHFE